MYHSPTYNKIWSNPNYPHKDSKKGILIFFLILAIVGAFFYFAFSEGTLKGYTVAKFESVQISESPKGQKTYYVNYDMFGTKVQEKITGVEYADIKQNEPEYLIVSLYETTFDFGNKIRLGVPNDGGYSVEKYSNLVAEEVKIIEEHNNNKD